MTEWFKPANTIIIKSINKNVNENNAPEKQ